MRALIVCFGLTGCHVLFDLERVGPPPTPDAAPDTSDLPPGLVAWYPMDGLTGNDVSDVTGGHPGTCTECPGVTLGRIDNALGFDGADDLVVVAGSADFLTLSGFTVSAWIRSGPAQVGYRCPVSKQYGSGLENSWNLCVHDGMSAFITQTNVLYGPTIVPGLWYHVAIRWDGATKGLWIDGNIAATATMTGIVFDTTTVSLGGDIDNGGAALVFDGAVDDVRIYSRALADTEIAALAFP